MDKFIRIKNISSINIENELKDVDFDVSYIKSAAEKYEYDLYKIFDLTSPAANILKQLALSVGTDCAVNKHVITNSIEYSDCILGATKSQLKNLVAKLKKQPFNLKNLAEIIEKKFLKQRPLTKKIRNTVFDFSQNKYIMGILNITPDSFSDGGKYNDLKCAIAKAEQMIAAGADIIDIGAESTKPGAVELSVEEEQTRLIPVLQAIRAMNIEIPISVDTRNAKTAEIAIKNGADIINDVSFGDYDKNMLKTIVNLNVPYVLTHSQGTPQNMQINPKYNNVVDEVYFAIEQKVHKLCEIGLNPENLIIDVGIGFGKTVEHNYELIKHIDEFAKLNYPILVGHSKKSFLSKSLKISSESLALATSALSCYIWSKSVSIIRVHDIEQHKIVKNLINKLS